MLFQKNIRVLLIGDSNIKGYGCNLKLLLSNNYKLYSVAKPGSSSNELKNTAKEVISQLPHEDVIIICCGTNDYEANEFSLTQRNITQFVQANKHTNIILLNVPFRYDLRNSTSVNSAISTLNRKLKLVNVSPHASFLETDNNRNSFTKHGLHLNKSGKRLVTYQLASLLQSVFEQKTSASIILGWHNEIQDNNISICEGNQEKLLIRNSSRNKKIPITRSNDFLWQI
jgi:lysophospholipase L1-like esterase